MRPTQRPGPPDNGPDPDRIREVRVRESIRELEARFDARFQSVSARFVRVDNRFSGIDVRLDEVERRHRVLEERTTTRIEVFDAALTTADARIDELRERVGGIVHGYELDRQRIDRRGRQILGAVLASTAVTIVLWVGTLVLLLAERL